MTRFLDIIFSLVAIILLTPMLVPIAVVLKLTGENEVFFKQSRVGRFGKTFEVLKFATMLKDSPNLATGTITIKNDPRVLPVGNILRRTKINELPQLLNVLAGDMSLVGPRPQTKRCFDAFPEQSQEIILKVRPGLSGLGSIIFRNEDQMMANSEDSDEFYNRIIMPYKGQLEEWYVENSSVLLYFKIVFLTVWAVTFPSSDLVWRLFNGMPRPPEVLWDYVGFRK